MNKKTFVLFAVIAISLASFQFTQSLYAKGGGGGTNGQTKCSADQFECSDWSQCNKGKQSRTCELSFDCENTEDKMPVTSQSCTLECTDDQWSCNEWSECSEGGRIRQCNWPSYCSNESANKPETTQICEVETPKEEVKESEAENEQKAEAKKQTKEKQIEITPAVTECNESDYYCGDWGICEEDGRQRRTCQATNSCSGSAIPEQERICPGLKCEHLDTIKERIECRLKLSDSEAKKEKKILYAPEYCRIEEGAQEKNICINLYWAFEKCWAMPAGNKRMECGMEESGYSEFEDLKASCSEKSGTSRQACESELKEAVEHWMLFSLYELEFLAESLMENDRVNFDEVVNFDLYIEEQKAKIEESDKLTDWKKIVKDTKEAWEDFINQHVQ